MTAPATALQNTQLGVESTAGTPVAADTRLRSFGLTPSTKQNTSERTVPGSRYPSTVTRGKRWSEAGIDGFLAYNDLTYLLCSLFSEPTPVLSDTAAYTWTFTPDPYAPSTPVTYTFEVGADSGALVRKFPYGIVSSLKLDTEEAGVKLGGSIFGGDLVNGATKTAAPTDVALVPVDGLQTSCGFASTFAGAATALGNVLSISVEFGEARKPVFYATTDATFGDTVEVATMFTAKLLMAADATLDSLQDDRDAGTVKFFDWTMQSDQLITGAAATVYEISTRAACEVAEISEFKDQDGVYAAEVTLTGVIDPATDKVVELTLVNELAAL